MDDSFIYSEDNLTIPPLATNLSCRFNIPDTCIALKPLNRLLSLAVSIIAIVAVGKRESFCVVLAACCGSKYRKYQLGVQARANLAHQ